MTQLQVQYIDHMGSDLSVVRAATASFAKDPEAWDEVKHPRLINYLARGMTQAEYDGLIEKVAYGQFNEHEAEQLLNDYRHTPTHWSPFAHTAITLRLKAPIAIHAQFMKHTVGFAHNTLSRRYISDTPEVFLPTFRTAPQGNVKQGSGDVIPNNGGSDWEKPDQSFLQEFYNVNTKACIDAYNYMIKDGVAPEQARFVLPQGVMTEWVSTGSLYAWARLYNLRTDPHAQKEIQDLVRMVGDIIEPLYPVSWAALTRARHG